MTHLRTKKFKLLVLASLLVLGLTACNVDNDNRPLTRGYNQPNMLDGNDGRKVNPYTYDGITPYRNVTPYNRYDGTYGAYNYNPYGPNNVGPYGFRANQFRNNANDDADRMAETAARVNGVEDATVVIAGGNAYVGLDLEDRIQSTEANRVERNVYNALKRLYPRYNIRITSDADLFGRLRDVGDGIRGGTAVDRFKTDFRDFDNRFRTYRR